MQAKLFNQFEILSQFRSDITELPARTAASLQGAAKVLAAKDIYTKTKPPDLSQRNFRREFINASHEELRA